MFIKQYHKRKLPLRLNYKLYSINTLTKPSLFFDIVSLLLFIVHFANSHAFKGLTQKILIIWDITWLLLASIKLYLNTKLAVQENN